MPETTPDSPAPGHDDARFAFVAVVVANVALAFGPWFVRLADTGPVASAFWRIALAAPILIALAVGTGWRPALRSDAATRGLGAAIVLGGVCFGADLASWHLGILRTTLANATLFGNAAVLFFPIYGFIAMRALPTRSQALALTLAAAGAALLLGRSYQVDPKHLAGDLLSLLAGVLYTVYFISMARVRATMPPLPALALSTMASMLPLLLFATLLGERIWPEHWGVLIGLALASQVLGQGLMIYAIGRLSPLVMGVALLVQPIVSATVGWLVYNERLDAADLVGAVLVAAALVLVRRTG